MEISPLLTRLSTLTLDALFKAAKANLRVHGEQHIPDGPVLYVVNHFTRIETIFLPYIIFKKTGHFPLSLADHTFFSGNLGRLLTRYGAVSTGAPDRDSILLSSLISGRYPVVIFPEGQMLKDKKLIEKGKYMVYNTGIRRPPHTGSASLALRSQFYREKIRHLHDTGQTAPMQEIMRAFDLSDTDLPLIREKDTLVVPVNITYYPIRARENAISRFMESLLKKVPERLEEELEVEGTMLLEGTDIDIRFGRPIPVSLYLNSSRRIRRKIEDSETYLEDFSKKINIRHQSLQLMYRYMDAIYGMTTVNHDHIFSWILSSWPGRSISERDFKSRAFTAIEKIQKSGIAHYHSCLFRTQYHLITDDEHRRYRSFIETAEAAGLITCKNGCIIKESRRFMAPYAFHTIRKDNILEVYKNEIEPMTEVTRILVRATLRHRFFMRRHIRRRFIDMDREIFESDYNRFYEPGVSKPREIGEPRLMRRWLSRRGVILVHGYLAAPEEIRPLAEYLYNRGYTVYMARLRGHGTSPEDLACQNWKEWYHSVNRAYIIMDNTVRYLSICGFSTGAGLALLQAANKGKRFSSVISINAPLHLQSIASRFSAAVTAWNRLLSKLNIERGRKEFVTNNPENPHINYKQNPISGVRQLDLLMKEVSHRLADVRVPALVIQGSDDPVVNPASAKEIFDAIKSVQKIIISVKADTHGIIRGPASDRVKTEVSEFLKRVERSTKGRGW